MKTQTSIKQVSRQRQTHKPKLARGARASANERTETPEGARRSGAGAHAQQVNVRRKGQAQKTALDVCVLLPGTGKQDTISRAVTEGEKGGQVSISPPLNIPYKPLLSGIDSLSLTIQVEWKNSDFFNLLDGAKAVAKKLDTDCPLFTNTDQDISFMVRPHGSSGYAWLIHGKEYALSIGNWKSPKSRPSIALDIRSETLWRYTPSEAVLRILAFLENQGAKVVSVKPSRLDLCLDLLFPAEYWKMNLLETAVTRASFRALYFERQTLTGIHFGKSAMGLRLYDKVLEIQRKSKKFWFHDLWKLNVVPEDLKVVRVEFQLRRGVLKGLGLDNLSDTFPTLENVWGYASQKWLTFKDYPKRQYHHRPLSPWWKTVQNSFLGIEQPSPLIRAKAIAIDQKRLARQGYGYFTSLLAIRLDSPCRKVTGDDLFDEFVRSTILAGKSAKDIPDDVAEKVMRFYRSLNKQKAARELREQNGFPCNLPKEDEP